MGLPLFRDEWIFGRFHPVFVLIEESHLIWSVWLQRCRPVRIYPEMRTTAAKQLERGQVVRLAWATAGSYTVCDEGIYATCLIIAMGYRQL
jgi:hypothetical protein